ncbi:MAG: hypothetical protein WA919_00880 [Coleofasciculaceae cyanobacterium]
MFTIDLTLKRTPMPLSIQRNTEEEAEATYKEIVSAMRSPAESQILELTCHKQTDKKIAVLSDQISAVTISQKSGAAGTGRAPGFLAMTE